MKQFSVSALKSLVDAEKTKVITHQIGTALLTTYSIKVTTKMLPAMMDTNRIFKDIFSNAEYKISVFFCKVV